MSLHPTILWAQRNDVLLVTIQLQDCQNVAINLKEGLSFSAKSENKLYECKVPLFAEVMPEESSHVVRPRQVELKIKKKEEEFWPRLTKEKAKLAYITVDWNKWKDEDELDGTGDDLEGFGMGGMGDMGGMGGMGGAGGFNMDEMLKQFGGKVPDFGGAAGQPEMGEEDGEEDDEMPPLEDN